ncbi:MAG: hypothetical protein HYU97_00430 [Deltaproteobacteria bacterium]|nr:hypothetical protein [Deltaproteobacteria bacterium]
MTEALLGRPGASSPVVLSLLQKDVTLFADEMKNKKEDCHARQWGSLAMTVLL